MTTETITTPDFMGRIEKIIAEVRARTGMDEIDTEIIREILQDVLKEYCTMLHGYYEEECYIAVSRARNSAYYDGFDDGYAVGWLR